MNSYNDSEKLELYAQQISESGIDITSDYKDWIEIAYACASQGEAGREPFHQISSLYPGYSHDECDKHFSYCLKTTKNCVNIGTLFKIAKDHGIDLKLPRGARPKTAAQKEEKQGRNLEAAAKHLKEWAKWWYNSWTNRVEIQEPGGKRRPFTDRDTSTYYCRLKKAGIRISSKDVEHLINSRDFAADDDPFRDYFDSLEPWKEGDPDYIHDFFVGHMVFGDPENADLYDRMFRKWFVGMVALWLGHAEENPIVPVLYGNQHIGKTYFVRHILPPQLRDYLFPVNPSARVDKDFEIAMSETPIMFLDEFNVNNLPKSEAYKYAITASKSYLRESYGHHREMRGRKASLIAATNHEKFIRGSEGSRRYLAVNLVGTVNLKEHALPYEGAYAQAHYLLEHGYSPKPDKEESMLITEHAQPYVMNDDTLEALLTFVRHPAENETTKALSAGNLMRELNAHGFHGKEFSAVNIGKAMKAAGFTSKKIHGTTKYLVVMADFVRQEHEQLEDARLAQGNSVKSEQDDDFDFEQYVYGKEEPELPL